MIHTCLHFLQSLAIWHKAIHSKPGIPIVSLSALEAMVDAEKLACEEHVYSLIYAKIALRRQVELNGKEVLWLCSQG